MFSGFGNLPMNASASPAAIFSLPPRPRLRIVQALPTQITAFSQGNFAGFPFTTDYTAPGYASYHIVDPAILNAPYEMRLYEYTAPGRAVVLGTGGNYSAGDTTPWLSIAYSDTPRAQVGAWQGQGGPLMAGSQRNKIPIVDPVTGGLFIFNAARSPDTMATWPFVPQAQAPDPQYQWVQVPATYFPLTANSVPTQYGYPIAGTVGTFAGFPPGSYTVTLTVQTPAGIVRGQSQIAFTLNNPTAVSITGAPSNWRDAPNPDAGRRGNPYYRGNFITTLDITPAPTMVFPCAGLGAYITQEVSLDPNVPYCRGYTYYLFVGMYDPASAYVVGVRGRVRMQPLVPQQPGDTNGMLAFFAVNDSFLYIQDAVNMLFPPQGPIPNGIQRVVTFRGMYGAFCSTPIQDNLAHLYAADSWEGRVQATSTLMNMSIDNTPIPDISVPTRLPFYLPQRRGPHVAFSGMGWLYEFFFQELGY